MDDKDKQVDLLPNEWKSEDKRPSNQPFWGTDARHWGIYAVFWMIGFFLWSWFTGRL